jgi:hypothetical protein
MVIRYFMNYLSAGSKIINFLFYYFKIEDQDDSTVNYKKAK